MRKDYVRDWAEWEALEDSYHDEDTHLVKDPLYPLSDFYTRNKNNFLEQQRFLFEKITGRRLLGLSQRMALVIESIQSSFVGNEFQKCGENPLKVPDTDTSLPTWKSAFREKALVAVVALERLQENAIYRVECGSRGSHKKYNFEDRPKHYEDEIPEKVTECSSYSQKVVDRNNIVTPNIPYGPQVQDSTPRHSLNTLSTYSSQDNAGKVVHSSRSFLSHRKRRIDWGCVTPIKTNKPGDPAPTVQSDLVRSDDDSNSKYKSLLTTPKSVNKNVIRKRRIDWGFVTPVKFNRDARTTAFPSLPPPSHSVTTLIKKSNILTPSDDDSDSKYKAFLTILRTPERSSSTGQSPKSKEDITPQRRGFWSGRKRSKINWFATPSPKS